MPRPAAFGRLWNSPRARARLALGCIALMLIATNIIAARFLPERLDLTAEHLYTLSSSTRRTLARIDEPITLRLYYSAQLGDRLPAYRVYAQRVRELLDQYVAAAHRKIRLEIYDPQPFSDAEDRALAFGLQSVPLDAQGEQVYFGLAGTNATDDRQVIRFFNPDRDRLLEYDLTRLVHNLAFPKRTVVGLISTLPLNRDPQAAMQGEASPPMAFLQQLRQLDEVETLPIALAAIPAGTDVLLLVQPNKLPPETLFAIDQFVLHGGKAIVFVDPYSELAVRSGQPAAKAGSDLAPLFKAWGLRLVPDAVAADRLAARQVVVPKGAGGGEVRYVGWINLQGADLNHADVITANLHQIAMASSGILEPVAGAATTFEPLVTTSRDAMRLPVQKVEGLPDVVGLLMHFKPAGTRYVLAARIAGPAATAFPGGPPKAAAKQAGDFVRQSVGPINVVVVADTDMLDDRFWAHIEDFFGREVIVPIADNGDFVSNAIDVLAGGADLIGLRSRGSSARPFLVIQRIQRAADDRFAAERRPLEQKLKATQAKLRALTTAGPGAANAPLSAAQETAVEQFRAELLATRRALRGVRRAQREDTERLEAIIEAIDIAAVPLIVVAVALVFGARRRRRWQRRRTTAPG
ncbi:MAG TPA: Gldg family protein [Stellaceae bacterium]|nr:Gldg family protein [Stellaceae bacterium]